MNEANRLIQAYYAELTAAFPVGDRVAFEAILDE